MGTRPTITGLPEPVREWLEHELLDTGFAGYSELTEKLQAKLEGLGLEMTVSRSAVHRFGKSVEERIEGLRRTTQIAKTLAREVEDDEGAVNDITTRLIQDKLFSLLCESDGGLETKDLASIGHVVADLSRASVVQKKWQLATRERAAKVADAVAEKMTKSGLTPEAADAIRRDILGIAA